MHTGSWAHPASVQWVKGFYIRGGGGGDRPRREAHHSPFSHVEVKNGADAPLLTHIPSWRVI
jgi:hypothetical protein